MRWQVDDDVTHGVSVCCRGAGMKACVADIIDITRERDNLGMALLVFVIFTVVKDSWEVLLLFIDGVKEGWVVR